MKRKKFKSTLFIVAMLTTALFSSCSKDNNNADTLNKAQGLQFSFTEEGYGEDESLTRATAPTPIQTIDLGDCEAEVSIESESAKPLESTTRAITNKHYTIRAYQGGAMKGEMKGTFNGSDFTTDAGSVGMVQLEPGTYDFVAFNDDVTASGDNLTVTEEKLHTARMAIQTIVITKQKDQLVSLQMKHVAACLRIQFVCQKDIPIITADIEAVGSNVAPISITYNATTKTYTSVNGVMTTKTCNFPASTQTKYSASDYTSTSNYNYFFPTTEGSKLKLTFSSGTLFARPLSGSIPQLGSTLSIQQNKSYLIKIKLRPNRLYLFSDGTTGYFKDEIHGGGSKTAIGVVVNKDKRVAIAVNDAYSAYTCQWCSQSNWHLQMNTGMVSYLPGVLSLENGYYETWDANASTSNVIGDKIKGNNPNFPAFYYAGNYNPGITLTGTIANKKWYLPSYGEIVYAFTALGFGDKSAIILHDITPWYSDFAELVFTQVGGLPLSGKWYMSSSEFSKDNTIYSGGVHVYNFLTPGLYWSYSGHNQSHSVRAFINY